jgi:hypothetical protein
MQVALQMRVFVWNGMIIPLSSMLHGFVVRTSPSYPQDLPVSYRGNPGMPASNLQSMSLKKANMLLTVKPGQEIYSAMVLYSSTMFPQTMMD